MECAPIQPLEPHPTHPYSWAPAPSLPGSGDVENWARSIELDMRTIAALEYVYKGQLQSAPP